MSTTASHSTEIGTNSSPSLPEDLSSTSSTSSGQASFTPNQRSGESHTCPYEDCRKSFSKKYNLKAHLRLHTGEQPFECDRPDCRKKFKWRSSLSSHTVWHSRKDKASLKVEDGASSTKKASISARPENSKSAVKSSSKKSKQKVSNIQKAKKTSAAPAPTALKQVQPTPSTASTKKKRPRTDGLDTRTEKISPLACSTGKRELGGLSPSASQVFSSVSQLGDEVSEKPAQDAQGQPHMRSNVKKRRVSKQIGPGPSECVSNVEVVASSTVSVDDPCLPGSPVVSDDGLSQDTIELDIFPSDLLPPLGGESGGTMCLEGGNVEAMLIADDVVDLFGETLPSCGALNALDTRFGPFDLDNLQTFGLNKADDF